jgi:hypothetical protein
MHRLLTLSVLILACVAARAEAIEMFTDFHNGENVGFPPMQVPYGIYGGFGHGGWNPNAEGMPLKTWPPVPAMMPTGQIPGGFRRINNTGNSNGGPSANVNGTSNSANNNSSSPPLISDRRRGRWLRGDGYTPDTNGNGAQNSRISNGGSTEQKMEPTPAPPPTTILHAGEGAPPIFEPDPKATPTSVVK